VHQFIPSLRVRYLIILQGIVSDYFSDVIIADKLLNVQMWRTFQDSMNSVIWPSQIGRLPTNASLIRLRGVNNRI
jgi:hypothetical protein